MLGGVESQVIWANSVSQVDGAKLSFGIQGHIKSFSDKKKLREFTITKPFYMKC